MASSVRVVTKNLGGLEDLLLGTGSEVQQRASGNKSITKVSGSTLPFAADLAKTIASVLASTATGEGASVIGVEDVGSNFVASDLEAVLLETITAINSNLTTLTALQSIAGAALIGVQDAANNFTGVNVETALAELFSGKASSGVNSDITSLTGLTTALAAAFGGTGLNSPGASGNVLTSDGTLWQSSPGSSLLPDGSVQGIKMSTVVQSTGSQVINAGANWVPPNGEYQFTAEYFDDSAVLLSPGGVILQLFIGGGWVGGVKAGENNIANAFSGLVRCDGANMRLYNDSGTTLTVSYQKL